jgi:UDP:flavonoid glycosyltransferase YjiC (YdhE family)
MPTLVLWHSAEQPIWGNAVKRLGAGTSRSFAKTTRETLRVDLRGTLAPACQLRARTVAGQMVAASVSRTRVADLLERAVASPRSNTAVSGHDRSA